MHRSETDREGKNWGQPANAGSPEIKRVCACLCMCVKFSLTDEETYCRHSKLNKHNTVCVCVLQLEEVLTSLFTKTSKLARGQMAFNASVHIVCLLASHHLLQVVSFLLEQPLPWSE